MEYNNEQQPIIAKMAEQIADLAAENTRLNALIHTAAQRTADDFKLYIDEARKQAARECVGIAEGIPSSVSVHATASDTRMATQTKDWIAREINAHFGLEG